MASDPQAHPGDQSVTKRGDDDLSGRPARGPDVETKMRLSPYGSQRNDAGHQSQDSSRSVAPPASGELREGAAAPGHPEVMTKPCLFKVLGEVIQV